MKTSKIKRMAFDHFDAYSIVPTKDDLKLSELDYKVYSDEWGSLQHDFDEQQNCPINKLRESIEKLSNENEQLSNILLDIVDLFESR